MKVIYVAGRFRGKTGWDVAKNIRAAEVLGFEVAELGAMPLIPHANTAQFNGTLTDRFWLDGTLELLRRCDALITVPGWEHSEGAKGEVTEAVRLGLPVFHATYYLEAWLREAPAQPPVAGGLPAGERCGTCGRSLRECWCFADGDGTGRAP